MSESWLPVSGWEGIYEVSNRGRVRSIDRLDNLGRRVKGRILVQKLVGSVPTSKRWAVQLCRNGKPVWHYVHIIMLEAFVEPRPAGMVGCHRDDTPRNDLSNLRWDTPSANTADLIANGNHSSSRKTHCAKFGHELTEDNVYRAPGKRNRHCRKCMKIRASEGYLRRKEAS